LRDALGVPVDAELLLQLLEGLNVHVRGDFALHVLLLDELDHEVIELFDGFSVLDQLVVGVAVGLVLAAHLHAEVGALVQLQLILLVLRVGLRLPQLLLYHLLL
jgi:hypothetical protein